MAAIDYSNHTVLVTGASSGIGSALAAAFAHRGADVVLVARRLDRLRSLADELIASYGIRATTIEMDLSQPAAGRALATEVDRLGLEITGLVNNAGFGTDGPFHGQDIDTLATEISLNVGAVVDITRAFIDRLRDAPSGILVNVASNTAYQPIPGMAVYAATKAFVLSFTEALWGESRGTGLRILSLAPGLTGTEFFRDLTAERYRGKFETPEQVATTAMRALDRGRRPSVVSGLQNAIVSTLSRVLTRRRTVIVVGSAFND